MFYCGRGRTRRGNEISRYRGNGKKSNTGMKENKNEVGWAGEGGEIDINVKIMG